MRRLALFVSLLCAISISSAQSLEKHYRAFQQSAQKEYADFREAANAHYADFLRAAWEYYKVSPAIPRPQEDQVPPVIYEDDKTKNEDVPIPYSDVIPLPQQTPQPQPIAPIIENNETETLLDVNFYNTSIKIRFPKQELHLADVKGENLAIAWEELSSEKYNNLILDCLTVRERLRLCDWAYINLLQLVSEQACGNNNAAVLLQAFLYVQSGYQMRLAVNKGGKLFLLVGSQFVFYDRGWFEIDGEKFYPLEMITDGLAICNGAFENEQPLSLLIPAEQHFNYIPSVTQTRKAQSGFTAKICVNQNLIDFYNNYPTGHYGDDFSTRWTIYAETPLDESTRGQLYPILKHTITGLSEVNAVNLLLNWVQTAFEYEYDDKVWGVDRAFFPAESLYYPYCDCEDRSILFSRIVRDLLGLDVILLYYPGHLATAVNFHQDISGDYLMIDGRKFIVCDPTYIGAPIGATMPDMDNNKAKVIILQ